MEKDRNPVTLEIQKKNKEPAIWSRRVGGEKDSLAVCFATSFTIGTKKQDLTSFAKTLPEGVVICDPALIAGVEHVEAVLLHTREYWRRNERIAKNGSIEILMRLTGKSQISEALEASGIRKAKSVAMLGLVSSEEAAEEILARLTSTFKSAVIDRRLIDLDPAKSGRLKKFHGLPDTLSDQELQIALEEKSVLLIFSR